MSLNKSDQALLGRIYRQLDPFEALQPDDPRYEPIYTDAEREDPVARFQTHIEWHEVESFQLFSGFRGSGKTTELFRLRKMLQDQGHVVIYANALDYLNPAEPLDISDLLMVLAGAFSDRLEEELGIHLAHESFWTRLTNYLQRTSLSVTEATASVEADSPAKGVLGGLKGGLDVKLALKEASSFRARLREFLQSRLPELNREANAFVEEGIRTIRKQLGEDKSIVFIFDQLEQLRGSASNEQDVIQSVERVFSSHRAKLRFPYLHVIYTVPPWLKFVLPGTQLQILPTFRLWKNDTERNRHPPGWDTMRRLVARRFPEDSFERVFGEPARSGVLCDPLIAASGGHFRDLFRLLREVLVQVRTRFRSLPVTPEVIQHAIARVREDYLPLADEDAHRLAEIERARDCVLPRASADEAARTSRLFDLHLVLYFSNGGDWYDTHPLVREEIATITKRSTSGAS